MARRRTYTRSPFLSSKILVATVLIAVLGVLAVMMTLAVSKTRTKSAIKPFVDVPSRGLIWKNIQRGRGVCAGGFQLAKAKLCTPGPHPAPQGVNVLAPKVIKPPSERVAADCIENGTSGNRIQVLYAQPSVSSGDPLYGQYAPLIQSLAASLNGTVAVSARQSGGPEAHIRFVTDQSCLVVVDTVTLPGSALADFDSMITELKARGYNRADRKYLVWADATVYCGIATLWWDDKPSADNRNNTGPSFGRIDKGCWTASAQADPGQGSATISYGMLSAGTATLGFMLGAVQKSAPHSDGQGGCTDAYEAICEASAVIVIGSPCPISNTPFLDCNSDDYFSTAQNPADYLKTHWNIATSSFLTKLPAPAP